MLKIVATAILIAIGALVAAFAYVHWGLRREGAASTYGTIFSSIVVRAIQLDRVGEMGIAAQKYHNGLSFPMPRDMTEAGLIMGGAVSQRRRLRLFFRHFIDYGESKTH